MAAGKKKDRCGNRTRIVKVRLTEDEFALMRTVMEAGGYPTVSCFLREVITRKRLPSRRETAAVDDGYVRQELNRLVYEVNRIGVNYNQVVATYQRLSKERRPDGSPYLNTRLLDEKVTALMRSTEGLRDEFAVVLDVIKRYKESKSSAISRRPPSASRARTEGIRSCRSPSSATRGGVRTRSRPPTRLPTSSPACWTS